MDKAGIGITIAVVSIALAFTLFFGTSSTTYNPMIDQTTNAFKETSQEIRESSSKTLESLKESSQKLKEEANNIEEITKDITSSKLPARLVSLPIGTSIPGCEEINLCYDPPSLTIFVGGEIIWKNNDNSAHTVTSGNIIEGPDGVFDSGLIKTGETFSFKFEKPGNYSYFCMIHPWATGVVKVS